MARSQNRLARDSPLPSSAQRLKTGDQASNHQSERNPHYTHSKLHDSADLATHPSDDRGVPVHSSGISPTSKDTRPPLKTPDESNSPKTNVQGCAQKDKIYHDSLVREDSLTTSPSPPFDLPGNRGNVANSSSKNASMERVHTMPVNRKISRDQSSSASSTFPRASVDNDGPAASSSSDRDGRRNDQPITRAMTQTCIHHRSTSGTSELSTASGSSMSKPNPHYVHPMRQAPRTYTPPLNQSYQTSIAESDNSVKGGHAEEDPVAQWGSDSLHQSMRGSSGQTPRLSLQIQEDPFTKLHGTSQTNLSGRQSFGYSRDAGSLLDTASPISRSSLDFSFRSRTRTSMDPISRAATVQAARQAFEEKEAAKARKLEEQQLKAEAREIRRKEKQPWRVSLRQDEEGWQMERSEVHGIPAPSRPASQPEAAVETWKPQPKNTWMHFLTWLRTRLFKIRRRIN